jgi:pyruvate formate lyase activating enzyme
VAEDRGSGTERAQVTGTIFRIARYAVHDGPGIRTTIFLKGCPLRCWWCHSPESQVPSPELALKPDRCARCGTCVPFCPNGAIEADDDGGFTTDRERCEVCGTCARACPSGAREMAGVSYTVDQLMVEIEKDVVFFDESGGGVTFSGGEPLMQPAFLEAVLARCRAHAIHTAVDTCGLADPGVLARVSRLANLFLFDMKVMDDERHRDMTGVSNVRILANLRALVAEGANVRVRVPLVPGLNDDRENLRALGSFVRSLGLRRIDVLPYHRAGIAKYARLNLDYRLPDIQPPSEAAIDGVVYLLQDYGLLVQVGG